ncbi:MAG: glycosyltransferase family 2 protein [Anaerolineae bacterium]|nr:glycosyltransferase family 2 protein [Anaerolineae bacterium]
MSTNAHPSITVIIPVYNGARTLAGCLDAIYASEYAPCEVIVVDDRSTDNTLGVASGYPCRMVRQPANFGAAQAKNRGAEEASGEILFFTDADIHIEPTALGYVAQDLADPEVAGVVGLLAESCPYTNFASQFKNLWMHFTYRRQPQRGVGLFFTSAAAIRRRIFLAEGGFDAHYRGASITEDIEFGQRLLGRGYTLIMDQRLTVEHQKHYTTGEVLRTDLYRARGLIQTWLRNHFMEQRSVHYASVPWYFGAGVAALGIATLMVALGLGLAQPCWLIGAAALVPGALLFNVPMLLFLRRARGVRFAIQSAAFILVDLYISGLGIALGLLSFLLGRRY